jgi:hypothetical protein
LKPLARLNTLCLSPKGGIQMAPLPTETKQAGTYDESTLSDEQLAAQAESEVQLKEHTAKSFLRNLFTKKGGHWAATMFQNERYPIKIAEDRAQSCLGYLNVLDLI